MSRTPNIAARAPSRQDPSGRPLATFLRAQAAALLAAADTLDSTAEEERAPFYDADNLPAGCPSWRACRESASRLGIPVQRVGRRAFVDRRAWDERHSPTVRTRGDVDASDLETIREMGVVLPFAAGGRR